MSDPGRFLLPWPGTRHGNKASNGPGGMPVLPVILLFLSLPVSAADVRYTLTYLGGSTWEYRYTVLHDGTPAGVAIDAFAVGFDPALYDESTLSITTSPPLATGWDEDGLASGVALDAFYDVQARSRGIAPGESAAGFSVQFGWLGPGVPGGQDFWIFEPGNPLPLMQGRTRAAATDIPLGGPWLNLLLAIVLLVSAYAGLRRAGRT